MCLSPRGACALVFWVQQCHARGEESDPAWEARFVDRIKALEGDVASLHASLAQGGATKQESQSCPAAPEQRRQKASQTPDGRFPIVPVLEEMDTEDVGMNLEKVCGKRLAKFQRRMMEEKTRFNQVLSFVGPTHGEGVSEFMQMAMTVAVHAARKKYGLHIQWTDGNLTGALVPNLIDWDVRGAELVKRCAQTPSCTLVRNDQWAYHLEPFGWWRTRTLRDSFSDYSDRSLQTLRGLQGMKPLQDEIVAACYLNALFKPSPQLSTWLPNFNAVYDTLRSDRILSIAIYFRTYKSEKENHQASDSELETASLPNYHTWELNHRYGYAMTVLCALQLESRWAAGFDRVVWFVSGDHAPLLRYLANEFGESASLEEGSGRVVMTSGSHGRHSRPNLAEKQPKGKNGYPQAVAEAIGDWWLLGEADFAVHGRWRSENSESSSFMATAMTRNSRARSFYLPTAQGPCPEGTDCMMPTKHLWEIERPAMCDNEANFQPMWGHREEMA